MAAVSSMVLTRKQRIGQEEKPGSTPKAHPSLNDKSPSPRLYLVRFPQSHPKELSVEDRLVKQLNLSRGITQPSWCDGAHGTVWRMQGQDEPVSPIFLDFPLNR